MGKKKIIFLIMGVTFIVLTLVLLVYLRAQFLEKTTQKTQGLPTPTSLEELASWKDQSGFTFQYPKSLSLDPHEEDKENYAHVELTSATYAGSLIVWAKDTTADDIEAWIKQKKIQNAIDSTLGGEPAKKILETGDDKEMIVTTIHEGYLYQIETNLVDEEFWSRVFNQVNSSFKFIQPKDTSEKSQDMEIPEESLGEEIIDEGEEVIE